MFNTFKSSINQSLDNIEGHSIVIKREDLIHPIISGNKFRKLKYVFKEVIERKIPTVITFGGAFSNHLAAVASAGKSIGVQTVGIIRGDEWKNKINKSVTLSFCKKEGMHLICIPRKIYAEKDAAIEVQQILKKYPKNRLIPEGGTETLAIQGCSEIMEDEDLGFDSICCSIGSGGTFIGLIESSSLNQKVVGFNALNQCTHNYNTAVGAAALNANTTANDVSLENVENLDAQNQAQTGLIAGTTITGGGITLSSGGNIKGGQTDYNTGTG